MKILYDHQIFLTQKYGGISKYFSQLMTYMPPEMAFDLSVLWSDNQYLKESTHLNFKGLHIPLPDREVRWKLILKKRMYYFNTLYSKKLLAKNDYDIFHPTYYDPYYFDTVRKPYVITVHDLIDHKFKNPTIGNPFLEQIEKTIKNASRIIAISENTKRDIIDIFNINSEIIDVIYHGYNVKTVKKKKNNFGRYILFVGRRSGYKNFETFAEAISALMHKEKDLKLMCVGDPFKKDEVKLLDNLQILNRTITLGVSEEELSHLYSNALVFVYPTLYEGFGMPVLEAFANECPVCLSRNSSLPEIAGEAAQYFDPLDKESILDSVEKVLYNDELSRKLVEGGKNRLSNFSWESCAEKTIRVYEKASR